MPEDRTQWRVTYRPSCRRAPEDVHAFELRREGSWLVFDTSVLVIGLPRVVVALRVRAEDVVSVRKLGRA